MPRIDLSKVSDIQDISPVPIPTTPNVSPIESALRGGIQGLSMGFADEATARLESLLGETPLLPKKSYEQALQESRQAYKQAQEANPITYTGSEIGGSILPMAIPGAGALNVASKIPMAGKALVSGAKAISGMSPIAKGIGTGLASGLGYSEGQNLSDIAQDTAIGGVVGGAIPTLAKGFQGAKKLVDPAIKKGIQGATGVSSELLTEAEKNPKLISKILNEYEGRPIKEIIPERANIVENFMQGNPIAQRAKMNSRLAVESIPENVTIDKQLAIKSIDDQIAKLEKSQGISDVRNQAIEMLNTKKAAFEKLPDQIKGSDLKPILQGLDEDIAQAGGWQNPLKNNAYRDGIENVRKSLDHDLKNQVPEYDRLMKKVAKDYALSNNLTKRFATEKGFDENKIASTLKTQMSKQDTNLTQDLKRLKAFGKAGGQGNDLDLNQFLNEMTMKKNIEQYGGRGSSISNRITGLASGAGATLGGLPGMVIGTGLGSVAGSELEKRGGQLALKALEATKGLRNQSVNPINQNLVQGGTRIGSNVLNDFLSQQRSEIDRKRQMESRGQSK